MANVPLVLCVCSGNIGRSPIMAAKLRQLFREHGMEGHVVVDSAGITGTGINKKGEPSERPRYPTLSAYEEGKIMLPYLDGRGLILHHLYQLVTRALVDVADLILVSAEDIRSTKSNALLVQFSDVHMKCMLLSELIGGFDGKVIDIPDFGDYPDPWEHPPIHRAALRLICGYLDLGFPEICKRLGLSPKIPSER